MSRYTIVAHPAAKAGPFTSIMITTTIFRREVEVPNVAEGIAALNAADAELQAAGKSGYLICGYFFGRDGKRRPPGYKAKMEINRAKPEATTNGFGQRVMPDRTEGEAEATEGAKA